MAPIHPKRLIGAITVMGNWAVQSFGYERYLPLGRPEILMQNLDRWGADEILLSCIDRGANGPNVSLLKLISKTGISTPLIYAGGIRSSEDAIAVIGAGADRVVIDSGWRDAPEHMLNIHKSVGAQAVIANVPAQMKNGQLQAFDYRQRTLGGLPNALQHALSEGLVSEIIVTDWKAEGTQTSFDFNLLDAFPTELPQLIAFGGLKTPQDAAKALTHPRCVAVGVGNYLSYREHAIQDYKATLSEFGVRPAQFHPFRTEQPINAPDL